MSMGITQLTSHSTRNAPDRMLLLPLPPGAGRGWVAAPDALASGSSPSPYPSPGGRGDWCIAIHRVILSASPSVQSLKTIRLIVSYRSAPAVGTKRLLPERREFSGQVEESGREE